MSITAIIVIKNEAQNLLRYFEHVRRFCDEIIVVDQHSTDTSLMLALKYADKVFLSKNSGCNELDRVWVVSLAKNEWVCTLDPDEQFENAFVEELPRLLTLCDENKHDGISCRIQNMYDGIEIGVGNFDQVRIARKTVKQSTRIHTGFAVKNPYITKYKQFHFKELEKALEINRKRLPFYDARITANMDKYYSDIKNDIDRYSSFNNNLINDSYFILNDSKLEYIQVRKCE